MSQMTAAARPLRAPRRGSSVAPLRVMPRRIAATGNGAFATLCLVLLTAGLIGLLLLNTALAQGSLAAGVLQRQSAVLSNSAADLNQQIAAASSSAALAGTASSMGMVRSNERAYLDLSAGTVTGTAYPATTNQALPIVTRATAPRTLSAADRKRLAAATASVLAALAPPVTAETKAMAKSEAKAKAKVKSEAKKSTAKTDPKPDSKPNTKPDKPATDPKKP